MLYLPDAGFWILNAVMAFMPHDISSRFSSSFCPWWYEMQPHEKILSDAVDIENSSICD